MKTVTFLRFLTFIGSGLTTLAALDLTGIANLLDAGKAEYLLLAGPAALALKELVVVLGDLFDDGKPNKSFKIGLFCFAMALQTFPLLSSCTTLPMVWASETRRYSSAIQGSSSSGAAPWRTASMRAVVSAASSAIRSNVPLMAASDLTSVIFFRSEVTDAAILGSTLIMTWARICLSE